MERERGRGGGRGKGEGEGPHNMLIKLCQARLAMVVDDKNPLDHRCRLALGLFVALLVLLSRPCPTAGTPPPLSPRYPSLSRTGLADSALKKSARLRPSSRHTFQENVVADAPTNKPPPAELTPDR